MAYSDIWTHANDADFQGRCRAALWDIANKVAASDEGYPATGQASAWAPDDQEYALKVLRDTAALSDRVLAMQVLRNGTIAANPAVAADMDIAWQINNGAWAELRRIG